MIYAFLYILSALLFYIGLFMTVWTLYLAVMNLKDRQAILPHLSPVVRPAAYTILFFGLVLDLLLNAVMSLVFLELPKEYTLSVRVSRLKKTNGWRSVVAKWICANFLDPFATGGHCK